MKFCQEHWDALREGLVAEGFEDLFETGETAALQLAEALRRGESSPATWNPLMDAHWSIVGNVWSAIERASADGGTGALVYLMQPDGVLKDPVAGKPGRTWPRCPLCYLNLAHEVSCTDPRCELDRERGYDWMIKRAIQDQVERAAELRGDRR